MPTKLAAGLNETHDPALESWVESANAQDSPWPIQNLPFGVFARKGAKAQPTAGAAIGDEIVDLPAAAKAGVFSGRAAAAAKTFAEPTLNAFCALGPSAWSAVRLQLSKALRTGKGATAKLRAAKRRCMVKQSDVRMLLPVAVHNYSDFFCSIHHVTNVGRALNRPEPLVRPAWRYLPVGYHSRASSVIVSGTPVRRPLGQYPEGNEPAQFRVCKKLDYELEMAAIVGPGNRLGERIRIEDAEKHIFGLVLMNDWSARDIQFWEGILGPFLGKSLSTTISPWIVTMDALRPHRAALEPRPPGDPAPLPHLAPPPGSPPDGFDIALEAAILSDEMRKHRDAPTMFTRTHFRHQYWSIAQMVAHHASNGCNLVPGDVLGTGTISGPNREQAACLVERTLYGREPVRLASGEMRGFVEDGDDVIFTGWARAPGYRSIGFGACRGVVTPAERT